VPGPPIESSINPDGSWFDRSCATTPRSARDWLVDATCFVLSALIAVSLTKSRLDSQATTLAQIAAVVTAAGSCLALWWRRRWPVPIAAVLAVLTCFWPASQLPALICLGTVAVRRSMRPLIAVVVIQLLSIAIRFAFEFPDFHFSLEIRSSSGAADGAGIVFSVLLLAIAITWGSYLRARRQLVASLRERAEKVEAEQYLRISQARISERTRIAREMHDVLAHRISLISLQAGALQVKKQPSADHVTDSATLIRNSAHRALDDLREVIGVLRADENDAAPLGPQPTFTDIPNLIEESVRAGMKVVLDERLDDPDRPIPDQLGRTAYRVVQEGLTNARKHAPGAVVTVTLETADGSGLLVEIRSARPVPDPPPGAGTSSIPGAGQGLVGLTERTRLIGGRLEHGWTPEGDFRLAAGLPLPEPR
jgi:signal transduction histidine kinase